MTTIDAITHIRREALSRAAALRYLIEHLGLCTTYADELAAVVFGDAEVRPAPVIVGGDRIAKSRSSAG